MFIQTESTPNPSTLKFIPGKQVLPEGTTAQIANLEQAQNYPLALDLLAIDGIKSVFLAYDFISVTKLDSVAWDIIRADVIGTIMDCYVQNKPIMLGLEQNKAETSKLEVSEDSPDYEIIKQIEEIIDTKVRPAVASDGGDVMFRDYKDGVVTLELHGACSGCPSSTATVKQGVERLLKFYIPEIESVESVDC